MQAQSLDFVLDILREAPATSTTPKPTVINQMRYALGLTASQTSAEKTDPRGGRVIDASSSLNYNNLHVQYRGGDFQALHKTPDGQDCSFMWSLPYADDGLTNASTLRALRGLRDKSIGVGGGNDQRWYDGMQFGVAIDG